MQDTIEVVGRALLTWDKKYPKGIIYNADTYTECEKELVAIVERFRDLLGADSKSEQALRILKSITLDNICDWQTMDVMQFENLCAQWTERSRSELGKRVMSEPQ